MIEVEGRSAKCEGVGTPIGPPSSVYIRLSQGPHERRMMLTHFGLAAAVYPGAGMSAKIRDLVDAFPQGIADFAAAPVRSSKSSEK
jgi:hypothetical protein